MRKILYISVALMLTSTASFSYENTIVVSNDRGGLVLDYFDKVKKISKDDTRVELKNDCSSMCTYYLTLPKPLVCAHKNTVFMFHPLYKRDIKGNRVANYNLTTAVFKNYPNWVNDFITKQGGMQNRSVKHYIKMHYNYFKNHMNICK